MRIPFSDIRKSAFTLVELLTVIAIISVLAALTIPGINAVMRSANAAKCLNNLKEIGSALHIYIGENNGLMPGSGNGPPLTSTPSYPLTNPANLNWFGTILSSVPVAKNRNVDILKSADYAKMFYCPTYVREYCENNATTSWTMSGYGFNNRLYYAQGDRTAYGVNRTPLENILFPARTIVVGDSTGWMLTPGEDGTVPDASSSKGNPSVHGGRAHYLYLDGHVEALTPEEAANALKFRQPTSS